MNRPEWFTILLGCIAAIACGATEPIFAVLLTKIINASVLYFVLVKDAHDIECP